MSRQVLKLQNPNSRSRSRSRSNSPTKLFGSVTPSRTRSRSNTRSLSVSPTKETLIPSSTLQQTNPSELLRSGPNEFRKRSPSFTIYQDDCYYRDTLQYTQDNEVAPVDDSDKENVGTTQKKDITQPEVLSSQRSPLSDLSIYQFPGFMNLHNADDKSSLSVLRPKTPLTTTWMISTENKSKKLYIPSFITPPKRNRVIKYVSSLNNKHKGPKRLDFTDDCRDLNALIPKPISLHYDNF
ncbi:BA75_04617T0 [Komagataella pastoris]|uniref:BA75_04617T0 n=1 Tax=Komagataella pastoris TaxID=4922 RepID=A0A1B2JI30_PICPA|nr:BA75_04617T0 [Komagataella pastoris]